MRNRIWILFSVSNGLASFAAYFLGGLPASILTWNVLNAIAFCMWDKRVEDAK